MHKYTCIIVDDEKHAIQSLKDSLEMFYKNIEVAGTYSLWEDALNALRENDYDIIFLDVSMGNKNGMDLLKYVPNIQSEIIFVTAYADHALEAFKLLATGYLVKPVDDAEFVHVTDKAIERVKHKRNAQKPAAVATATKIGISNKKVIQYVNISDIIYLEAKMSYTKVITTEGSTTSSYNLNKFKSLLSGPSFFQVHRSFIVNLDHIRRYDTNGILSMSNNDEVPVSRNFREDLLALFNRIRTS